MERPFSPILFTIARRSELVTREREKKGPLFILFRPVEKEKKKWAMLVHYPLASVRPFYKEDDRFELFVVIVMLSSIITGTREPVNFFFCSFSSFLFFFLLKIKHNDDGIFGSVFQHPCWMTSLHSRTIKIFVFRLKVVWRIWSLTQCLLVYLATVSNWLLFSFGRFVGHVGRFLLDRGDISR